VSNMKWDTTLARLRFASGLHSLRSFLDGCALSGLHSLRSSQTASSESVGKIDEHSHN